MSAIVNPSEDGAPEPHAASHQDAGSDEVALDASQVTTGRFPLARLPDAAANAVLKTSGVGVDPVYGQVTGAEIQPNTVQNSNIRQALGTSVIGRSALSSGNVADIVATSGTFLQRRATTLGFDVILATDPRFVDTARLLGRISAGGGSGEELTPAQATAILDIFTSALKGLVPASGGGTTNFLRADGTWAAPSGGGVADQPTFYAVFDRIAPAANKYMATLFNTSATRKVVIQQIWRLNYQVVIVTGALLEQYLARITARTAGASVAIQAYDSADVLSSGIAADTLSTGVTESHIIARPWAVSEEPVLGSVNIVRDAAVLRDAQLLFQKKDGTRGLVLRENEGISIRNITSATQGSVSYFIEFTDEPAA